MNYIIYLNKNDRYDLFSKILEHISYFSVSRFPFTNNRFYSSFFATSLSLSLSSFFISFFLFMQYIIFRNHFLEKKRFATFFSTTLPFQKTKTDKGQGFFSLSTVSYVLCILQNIVFYMLDSLKNRRFIA